MRSFCISFLMVICLIACSKNSVTGRRQLKLLPESDLQNLANQQYDQFLSVNTIVNPKTSATSAKEAEMVSRVGLKLSRAVENYFTSKGIQGQLKGYKWEYNLVE